MCRSTVFCRPFRADSLYARSPVAVADRLISNRASGSVSHTVISAPIITPFRLWVLWMAFGISTTS
jgi:hypothetical protein